MTNPQMKITVSDHLPEELRLGAVEFMALAKGKIKTAIDYGQQFTVDYAWLFALDSGRFQPLLSAIAVHDVVNRTEFLEKLEYQLKNYYSMRFNERQWFLAEQRLLAPQVPIIRSPRMSAVVQSQVDVAPLIEQPIPGRVGLLEQVDPMTVAVRDVIEDDVSSYHDLVGDQSQTITKYVLGDLGLGSQPNSDLNSSSSTDTLTDDQEPRDEKADEAMIKTMLESIQQPLDRSCQICTDTDESPNGDRVGDANCCAVKMHRECLRTYQQRKNDKFGTCPFCRQLMCVVYEEGSATAIYERELRKAGKYHANEMQRLKDQVKAREQRMLEDQEQVREYVQQIDELHRRLEQQQQQQPVNIPQFLRRNQEEEKEPSEQQRQMQAAQMRADEEMARQYQMQYDREHQQQLQQEARAPMVSALQNAFRPPNALGEMVKVGRDKIEIVSSNVTASNVSMLSKRSGSSSTSSQLEQVLNPNAPQTTAAATTRRRGRARKTSEEKRKAAQKKIEKAEAAHQKHLAKLKANFTQTEEEKKQEKQKRDFLLIAYIQKREKHFNGREVPIAQLAAYLERMDAETRARLEKEYDWTNGDPTKLQKKKD